MDLTRVCQGLESFGLRGCMFEGVRVDITREFSGVEGLMRV